MYEHSNIIHVYILKYILRALAVSRFITFQKQRRINVKHNEMKKYIFVYNIGNNSTYRVGVWCINIILYYNIDLLFSGYYAGTYYYYNIMDSYDFHIL